MKKTFLAVLLFHIFTGIAIAQSSSKSTEYKILLTGASFASPQNGWFEIGCRKLNAQAINRAIGGEAIANTANRMADGTLYSKEELEEIADKDLMNEEKNKKLLIKFMDSYSNDIWDAAVGIYQTFADNEEMLELKKYISLINELCYKKESADYSYLERTYSELLERKKKTNQKKISQEGISEEYVTEEYLRITYDDPYKTLKRLAMIKLKNYANKHYDVIEHYSNKFLKMEEEGILKILLLENNELPVRIRVVRANTQKILRMVLNTVYSYLFNIEISDHPVLAKKSKKSLTYGELRILSFLRNPLFTDEEFKKREISLED